MLQGHLRSGFIVNENRVHRGALQFTANDDGGDVMFLQISQQVDIGQNPVGHNNQAFNSLSQQNFKVAFKARPFALRVAQNGKIRCLIDGILDSFEDGRAKWI